MNDTVLYMNKTSSGGLIVKPNCEVLRVKIEGSSEPHLSMKIRPVRLDRVLHASKIVHNLVFVAFLRVYGHTVWFTYKICVIKM